jgi:hypothetical protein
MIRKSSIIRENSIVRENRIVENQVNDLSLADVQAGLRFQHLAHFHAIELLVALGARTPHCRAARGVQQSKLNADSIGNFAHDAAQSVDLADQMSLGHAAHGWIAAHLRNQVEVHGDDGGLEAHARRGHGRFASSVSCADYNHVVLFGKCHLHLFYGLCKGSAEWTLDIEDRDARI